MISLPYACGGKIGLFGSAGVGETVDSGTHQQHCQGPRRLLYFLRFVSFTSLFPHSQPLIPGVGGRTREGYDLYHEMIHQPQVRFLPGDTLDSLTTQTITHNVFLASSHPTFLYAVPFTDCLLSSFSDTVPWLSALPVFCSCVAHFTECSLVTDIDSEGLACG